MRSHGHDAKVGFLAAMLLLVGALATAPGFAAETPEILVKGLMQGRAILQVDGELLILQDGDVRKGVKLIHADNRAATLEVGGRRLVMALDQTIARSYSAPEPSTRSVGADGYLYRENFIDERQRGRTRIRSVRVTENSDGRVVLDVDYFYAGDHGGEVRLLVEAQQNDRPVASVTHTPSRLTEGARNAVVELSMAEDAPLVLQSDAIKLDVAWFDQGRQQGMLATRVVSFNKFWKKVRVR